MPTRTRRRQKKQVRPEKWSDLRLLFTQKEVLFWKKKAALARRCSSSFTFFVVYVRRTEESSCVRCAKKDDDDFGGSALRSKDAAAFPYYYVANNFGMCVEQEACEGSTSTVKIQFEKKHRDVNS